MATAAALRLNVAFGDISLRRNRSDSVAPIVVARIGIKDEAQRIGAGVVATAAASRLNVRFRSR